MRKILSRNPFTNKILSQFQFISQLKLQQKIKKCHEGYLINSKRKPQERAQIIANLAQVIKKNRKNISQLITQQMGKPIKQSQSEVDKSVSFCQYYSQNFHQLNPTHVKADAKVKTLIKYLPMGIVYGIVPFNFPFYLIFKSGLPNLLLGNSLLSRSSDSTPLLGNKVEQILKESGFNSGQFENVFTNNNQLEQIMRNPYVIGVSFTGSSKSGASIAEIAGRYLKRSVMELGGNDPFIVLSDCNLQLAVESAVGARCVNAGQVCFSPKRFIIIQDLYQMFKEKLIEKLKNYKYGNPMNQSTQMGPIAREDLYNRLVEQINNIPSSWKVVWKSQSISKPFYPITVIECSEEIYDEEIFGPVFSLYRAANEEHAIKIANSTQYGLGASVFSKSRGEEVLNQITSGMGFVNSTVKSHPAFPSGGVGKSGFGRECSVDGFRNFANVRTIYVN